jgi:hypothetical protein
MYSYVTIFYEYLLVNSIINILVKVAFSTHLGQTEKEHSYSIVCRPT